MPGFDGTGPMGAGPMTGGRRGLCNPINFTYPEQPMGSYGFRGAMGFGRGFRNSGQGFRRGFGGRFAFFNPLGFSGRTEDTATELEILNAQANSLKTALDSINRRISELEKTD